MVRPRNITKRLKRNVIRKNRRLVKKLSKIPDSTSNSSFNKDLLKIGSKSDLFSDSSSSTSYAWTRLEPFLHLEVSDYAFSGKGILSLKQICSKRLAENADSLESSFLDTAPWTIWKQVWEEILLLQNDSMHAFSLFANKFSRMKEFRCHLSPSKEINFGTPKVDRLLKIRLDAINSIIIPKSRNHRVENLFANINVLDIVKYIHNLSYRPWVLLDLSLMGRKYDREDYLKIFNINNLVALDLSNSKVIDDLFLYNLSASIKKEGKLSKLSILKINNCPNVTSKGLKYLLCLSNDPDFNNSLAYIESDIKLACSDFTSKFQNIRMEREDIIDNTRWSVLDDGTQSKSIKKFPLGLKLHCIYKTYSGRIIKNSSQSYNLNTTNSLSYLFHSRDKIVLDLVIHDKNFTSIQNDFEKLPETWETRIRLRNMNSTFGTYSYIINNNLESNVKPSESSLPNKLSKDSVMYRASRKIILNSTNKRKREKPLVRKVEVNKFFDM